MANESLMRVVDDYINQLKDQQRLAPNTIASYHRDLVDAARFLTTQQHLNWAGVDQTAILAFLEHLKGQQVAQETINRHIVSLRQLYKYLRQNQLVTGDPLANLTTSATTAKPATILTVVQVQTLLETINVASITGLRDRAMFELMYATGMRVNELLSLTMDDVDLNAQLVMPHDHAGRQRVIPISERCQYWLTRYLQEGRFGLIHDGTEILFLNNRGKALTRQAIWQKLKVAAKDAGLTMTVTPDVLRATFASQMLANGADLRAVQTMLGHQSLNTTERYAPPTQMHLAAQYRQYHPSTKTKEDL